MSNEEKQPSGLEVLESTLRKVAEGGRNVPGKEQMRAALALAYLLGDIRTPGVIPKEPAEAATDVILGLEPKGLTPDPKEFTIDP